MEGVSQAQHALQVLFRCGKYDVVALHEKGVEPVWASLEEALEAAQNCNKCINTIRGTKGC